MKDIETSRKMSVLAATETVLLLLQFQQGKKKGLSLGFLREKGAEALFAQQARRCEYNKVGT